MAMASILFIVVYLAVPMGLATLALFGRQPLIEEEAREPIKILAHEERRPR
jgi:hypothetical protein